MSTDDSEQPPYVHFFGVMGATSAMVFSGKKEELSDSCHICFLKIIIWYLALGAAYGTAKSGTGIAAMSVMRPELIMRSVIPVVMAGILGIYGLVVGALIGNGCKLLDKRFWVWIYSFYRLQMKNATTCI